MTLKTRSFSLRVFACCLLIAVLTGVAAFASHGTVNAWTGMLTSFTQPTAATPEPTPAADLAKMRHVVKKRAAKPLGSSDDRIIAGRGDKALSARTRRDKIYTYDAFGQEQQLTTINDFEPVYSPDGTWIAFITIRDPASESSSDGQAYRDLYLMNADGTDQSLIASGPYFGAESQPSFSPDGRYLVFVGNYSGQGTGIYGYDIYQSQSFLITDLQSCHDTGGDEKKRPHRTSQRPGGGSDGPDTPRFSPDGSTVIFGDYADDGNALYQVTLDSSPVCTQVYTDGSYAPLQADYSPDGSQIVVFSDAGPSLKILDAVTFDVYDQFSPSDLLESPVWSPDGTKIAYIAFDGATSMIRTFDVNTHAEQLIASSTVPEAYRGLDWGTPVDYPQPAEMRINAPHPLQGGSSTTATIFLAEAAPAGGRVFDLTAGNPVGQTTATVPATATVPEGATQVTFPISTPPRADYRVVDIFAVSTSPQYAFSSATLSVTPSRPDLHPVSLTGPASAAPGVPFQLDWVIENIGSATTGSNGGVDRVYFSLDNVYSPDDTYTVGSTNGALLPGASRSVSGTATIPQSAVPGAGQYYLILITNATNVVDEGGRYDNNTLAIPIQIDLADVVPENFAFPATTVSGTNYTVTWNVHNVGTVATGTVSQSEIFYSENDTLGDGDDVLLETVTTPALAGGQSVARSTTVKVPTLPVRSDGPGYFYLSVDSSNQINEGTAGGSGESNNIVHGITQFQYRVADLQVTASNVPAEVESDTPFAMGWTTANSGNRDAGTFNETIYFSADNQVGGDTELSTFSLAGGVTAGNSVDRIQNISIPTNLIPATGDFYVYVKTNSNSVIDEGANEGNNIRFQPIHVRRLLRPDLVVSNITAPTSVFFGQRITVQWTVTNQGSGPTNAVVWKDRVNLNTTGSSSSGNLIEVDNGSALGPGESYISSATIDVPNGYTGSYQFVVIADYHGSLNEESTTNNKLTEAVVINIPPLPDLTVTNVQAPEFGYPGQPFNVSWTVQNIGNADAVDVAKVKQNKPWSWSDRVYLSRDTVFDGSDIRIFTGGGRSNTPLAPNATYGANSFVPASSSTPGEFVKLPNNVSGLYYVFVVTDIYDSVYEYTGETNNFGYDVSGIGSPVNIIQTPADLIVPGVLTAPTTALAGSTYPMAFDVQNQGAYNTTKAWSDGIYLSNDAAWSSDDVLLVGKANSNIGPGGIKTISANVEIPFCTEGTKYLIAKTDTGNSQPEFDPGYDAEANNAGTPKQVAFTSLPMDLVASNVGYTTQPAAGQPLTITWTESNTGTGPSASSWTDRITLVPQSNAPAIVLVNQRMTGSLAAGASVARSVNVGLPAFLQDTYKIRIETDYLRNATECGAGEDNNVSESGPFSVSNVLPDLQPTAISSSSNSYTAGDPINITFNETNTGVNPAVGENGWTTYAYLSTDTTLSNSDYYVGTLVSTDPLNGGASRQVTIQGSIGNVPPGTYNLLIFADANKKVYEGPFDSVYETNNIASIGGISVSLPSVDLTATIDSVTTPTYAGQGIAVNYTVTNLGTQPTLTNGWVDRLYLSRDSVYDSSDVFIGWKNHQDVLTGGTSYSDVITASIPAGLTGDYRLFVITDAHKDVIEANDANNQSPAFAVNIDLAPPSDLTLTNVTPTANVVPGGAVTVNFTIQNSGPNFAYGKWRTSFYLSTDQFWDANDVLLGQKERNGAALGAGSTEADLVGLPVPMVPEGQYYVIGRVDSQNVIRESNEANNITTSGTMTTVSIETLTLGTPSAFTSYMGGQKLFKFLPPVDETVLVTLDGDAVSWNRLYTRASQPPSLSEFDFSDDGARSADKENTIANTTADKYYSLVRADFVPAVDTAALARGAKNDNKTNYQTPGIQQLTIKAETVPFSVRAVSPGIVGNHGVATLKISGAKFESGATIELIKGATVIPARLKAISTSDIRALFDLTNAPAGAYDVRVTNPSGPVSTKTGALTVVSGGGHALRVDIGGPSAVHKADSDARFSLSVINDGLNDAQAVPVLLFLPSNLSYSVDRSNYIDWPDEMLPEGINRSDIPDFIEKDGKKMLFFLVPIVQARSQVNINISVNFPSGSGFELQYGIGIPFGDLGDPANAVLGGQGRFTVGGGGLHRSTSSNDVEFAKCMTEFLRALAFFIVSEIGPAECAAVGSAVISGLADFVSGFALNLSTGQASEVSIAGGGLGFCVSLLKNAALCAGKNVPAARLISLLWGVGNLINQLLDCMQYLYRWGVGVIVSLDPNEKIGPAGYGPEHFVPIGKPLEYRINFENEPDASAPAQRIQVVDVLPPGLDPRTVRLKEIGFGHYSYTVPDNSAVYQSRPQLGADLSGLQADISGALDVVNRRVVWTMTALDPQTGERPLDPRLGLLPPNNENHDGEGYVIFTAQADAAMPTRTAISNIATIYFDENEPIDTNAAVNLIDSDIPSSQLAGLPATSDTPDVPYSWSGTDDADGSGFADCSLMASENNGAFLPNGVLTSLTGSGVLNGKWGKSYALYTICRDNAGNTEVPPTAPDASIRIRGGDTEGDVAPRPDGSDGTVTDDDVAEVRAFAAGLDASYLYNEFQRADTAPAVDGGDGVLSVADVIQTSRYANGIDAKADAAGPNAASTGGLFPNADTHRTDGTRNVFFTRVARGGSTVSIGIQIAAQGDEAGVGFALNYDPAVLSSPVVTLGQHAAGSTLTVNSATPGRLGIIIDRSPTSPLAAGNDLIAVVEFTVVPIPPVTTTLTFGSDPVKTEVANGSAAALATSFTDGTIDLLSPTAAPASVDGRVLANVGSRPIGGATVSLRSSAGLLYTAVTSPLGYFRFQGVETGETYVLSVSSKHWTFAPRVITVADDITGLTLMGEPRVGGSKR